MARDVEDNLTEWSKLVQKQYVKKFNTSGFVGR
ncbi:hypothetical protein HCH_06169 [Hahella chejuensis KCTC 2396]|uniref:Uncharacterized protein n=1 Tax=Hahella chejuensis (strain KCTC 2396) TaxID=349521 RepID=Q2S960_HAHCH|nr:hypothetical protein HCH_06169 [Hahella chejuensis KCTC 2396]